MTDLAVTAEQNAPAAPIHDQTGLPEVRVVDEREQEERADAKLNDELKKVFREAKRERTDEGKFKPKMPNGENDAAKALDLEAKAPALEAKDAKSAAEKPDTKAVEPPKETEEKPKAYEAPKHWSESAKAKFAAIPPDAQKEILDAAKGERQALTNLGNAVKSFEPIGKVLDEYKDSFRQKGLTYEQGVRQLLQVQSLFDNGRGLEAIQKMAQAYNIDLSKLAGSAEPDPYQLPPDPEVQTLKQQNAALQQRLNAIEGHLTQGQRQAREAHVQGLAQAIDAFAKDKPDFDDLEAEFESNFHQIRTANPGLSIDALMAQAYERAEWANPTTRAKALAREQKAAEAKRVAELEKAQKANALNVQGQVQSNGIPEDSTDLMRAVWRKRQAA